MKKLLSLLLAVILLSASLPALAETIWTCTNCGRVNNTNYCINCGAKKPTSTIWTCAWCKSAATGNYCGECGNRRYTKPATPTPKPTATPKPTPKPTKKPAHHWKDPLAGNMEFAKNVYATCIQKLSSYSGPSTTYTSTGNYNDAGKTRRLLSYVQGGSNTWVYCEVSYGGALRRVYTKIKYFDQDSFSLKSLPEEKPLGVSATVNTTVQTLYGPGPNYANYSDLKFKRGREVTINFVENDYAQVEFKAGDGKYVRVWVPLDTLDY